MWFLGQVLAAFGHKVGAAEVTKVTDKVLDDTRRKKLADLIAGGGAANGSATARCDRNTLPCTDVALPHRRSLAPLQPKNLHSAPR